MAELFIKMQKINTLYRTFTLFVLLILSTACSLIATKITPPPTAAAPPPKQYDSPLEQKVVEVMQCIQEKCEQQLKKRFVLKEMSYDNYNQWARTDIDYLFENAKVQCDKPYQDLRWEALKKRMKNSQLENSYNKEGLQMCIQSIASGWRKQHSEQAKTP